MTKISIEAVAYSIHVIRGEKVLLDADLATLYGVETRVLNQAVKRNLNRFPPDFMFQLTPTEFEELNSSISQIVISNKPNRSGNLRGGRQKMPYAFTEQGVAMLSSVLSSPRAIEVNIEIMRVFVKVRQVLATNEELAKRLSTVERTQEKHSENIEAILDVIRELVSPPDESVKKNPIGFAKE
jgi:hypothetical protein